MRHVNALKGSSILIKQNAVAVCVCVCGGGRGRRFSWREETDRYSVGGGLFCGHGGLFMVSRCLMN